MTSLFCPQRQESVANIIDETFEHFNNRSAPIMCLFRRPKSVKLKKTRSSKNKI